MTLTSLTAKMAASSSSSATCRSWTSTQAQRCAPVAVRACSGESYTLNVHLAHPGRVLRQRRTLWGRHHARQRSSPTSGQALRFSLWRWGTQVSRQSISVNKPLRYGGVTVYQTDWSMAAITLRAQGSPMQPADGSSFNLPMASLEGNEGAHRQQDSSRMSEGGPFPGPAPATDAVGSGWMASSPGARVGSGWGGGSSVRPFLELWAGL